MAKDKQRQTIRNRQAKQKELLLEQLRRYPIVLVACEKSGVARQTFYRWKSESKEFEEAAEKAMKEGEGYLNDLAEHQLVVLMRDKHWPALHYWLERRHPKFNKTKLEIDHNFEVKFNYDQQQ